MSHSYAGESRYIHIGCIVPESKLKTRILKGSFYAVSHLLKVSLSLALLISALTFLSIARNQMIPQHLETVSLNRVGTSGTFISRI